MEGTSVGEMLSAIRLARRSSSASTSPTPLTFLVRSSTPSTMTPPEVFANATIAFRMQPMGLVVLQSRYPVQAKKVPKRPFFSTMGRPQFSQYSSSAQLALDIHMRRRFAQVRLAGTPLRITMDARSEEHT